MVQDIEKGVLLNDRRDDTNSSMCMVAMQYVQGCHAVCAGLPCSMCRVAKQYVHGCHAAMLRLKNIDMKQVRLS